MRATWPEVLEKGRRMEGHKASPRGAHYGVFEVRHQRTRWWFNLYVADHTAWQASKLAGLWECCAIKTTRRLPWLEELHWIKDLLWEPEEVVHYLLWNEGKYHGHNICHLWKPSVDFVVPPPVFV